MNINKTRRIREYCVDIMSQKKQKYIMPISQKPTSSCSEKLLHQLFEDKVPFFQNNAAIITTEIKLTYGELSKKSNQLARFLLLLGAKKNTLIAIIMEKGWEQVVAVMAILKSGAAYLPIDPAELAERINHMLIQGDVCIVLTHKEMEKTLCLQPHIKKICIDNFVEFNEMDNSTVDCINKSTDLAYVIYTSGSTGIPKGVMIDHRGAVNTILSINEMFSVSCNDKIYGISALTFDLSVYDIFGVLATGATLVLPNHKHLREPEFWLRQIQQEKITIWNTVPTYFQMLVEYIFVFHKKEMFSCLRLALLSGDWIPLFLPKKARTIFKNLELVSLGGATEASIWSIFYKIKTVKKDWNSIPYGKELKNQKVYIYIIKI